MKTHLFCFFAILSASALYAQGPATFTSEPFALSISAPQTWKVIPEDFPTAEYETRNKNLLEVVTKHENLPIVRIVKPVAGNRTISPAIQIFVVPDGGQTPKAFLTATAADAAQAFEDFKIVHEASDTTLNGIKAAAIELAFTVAYPGRGRFPTLSRSWAIPRDKMMFVIAVTGQPDDLKALARDVDLILKSIHFKNE